MTLEEKKVYIEKFICQNITLEKAYQLTYCTADDIDKIEKDIEFINKINQTKLELSLKNMEMYNLQVDTEGNSSDHLRRLTSVMKVIDTENIDLPGDMHLTIIKQRGKDN